MVSAPSMHGTITSISRFLLRAAERWTNHDWRHGAKRPKRRPRPHDLSALPRRLSLRHYQKAIPFPYPSSHAPRPDVAWVARLGALFTPTALHLRSRNICARLMHSRNMPLNFRADDGLREPAAPNTRSAPVVPQPRSAPLRPCMRNRSGLSKARVFTTSAKRDVSHHTTSAQPPPKIILCRLMTAKPNLFVAEINPNWRRGSSASTTRLSRFASARRCFPRGQVNLRLTVARDFAKWADDRAIMTAE